MSDVRLTFRRDGERFLGEIDSVPFEAASYAEMMTSVHRILLAYPEAGLIMQRTEREGLMPVTLDPASLRLLREDPARFIDMHSPKPVVVDLTLGKRTRLGQDYAMPKHAGLRSGHATLAAAFGEEVYLRVRHGLIESPFDGRYAHDFSIEERLDAKLIELTTKEGRKEWIKVRVEDLLRTDALRFYLPREWNEFGSWISHAKLQTKYNEYKKELANVSGK